MNGDVLPIGVETVSTSALLEPTNGGVAPKSAMLEPTHGEVDVAPTHGEVEVAPTDGEVEVAPTGVEIGGGGTVAAFVCDP